MNMSKFPSVNYFDYILVAWLIVGVIRGRKHGMSEELLPVVQWLLIVVASSQLYAPVAAAIVQNVPGFDRLWANIGSYVGIALMLKLIFSKIKTAMGEKLVGSDMFGRGEYYLGILAGVIRFACMYLFFCAILNARIVTAAERAQTAKDMKQWAEGIQLPTYGSVQNGILNESLSGRFVKDKLSDFLIRSMNGEQARGPKKMTADQQTQKDLDSVLGTGKK